jgi:hypothetical protein
MLALMSPTKRIAGEPRAVSATRITVDLLARAFGFPAPSTRIDLLTTKVLLISKVPAGRVHIVFAAQASSLD